MKEYMKPELEIVSLVAEEQITLSGDISDEGIGATPGLSANPF